MVCELRAFLWTYALIRITIPASRRGSNRFFTSTVDPYRNFIREESVAVEKKGFDGKPGRIQ